jgi:hypothetical protein
MRPNNRITGPIGKSAIGNTHREIHGVNDWVSINPLDAAQGWTFRQSSQANLVSLSTSASGLRVQQDITKNASNESRWSASAMRADRYYAKLRGPKGNLTWSDNFTMEILISLESVGANTSSPDKSGIVVGLSDKEIETGESNVAWAGGIMYFNNYISNAPSGGMVIGGDTNTTSNALAGFRKGYVSISPVIDGTDDDGNPQTRLVQMQMLNISDQLVGSLSSGTQSFEYNADTQGDDPVYIFLAPTFTGTNGSNNTDTTFKAWYRITMTDLAPTYNPITG